MNKQILFVLVLLMFSILPVMAIAEDNNVPEETPEETPVENPEEITCIAEGESIPVIPDAMECCEGLTLIPPTDEEIVGISGYCTALCGDGECGEIETTYNCAVDCKEQEEPGEEPEEEPEEETEEEPGEETEEEDELDEVNPETGEEIADVKTKQEIAAMSFNLGSKIRLLQLEKSILRNILRGEAVIEFISENFEEEDISELEETIEELRVLKEEVAAINPEGEKEEIVKQFVDLKNDARALSKRFREATREILEGKDREGLAEKFKEIDLTELHELMDEVHELIREFNAQRIEKTFQNLEELGPKLAKRVRNGEIKMNGVRAEVGTALKALDKPKRNLAFNSLKEENAKKRVFVQAKILEAQKQFLRRRLERLENRIQAVKDNPKIKISAERIQERIQKRILEPKRTPRPPVDVLPEPGPAGDNDGNQPENNGQNGKENGAGNNAPGVSE